MRPGAGVQQVAHWDAEEWVSQEGEALDVMDASSLSAAVSQQNNNNGSDLANFWRV